MLSENVHKFVDVDGKGISLSFFSVLPLGGRDQSKKNLKLIVSVHCSFGNRQCFWECGGRGGWGGGGTSWLLN